MHIDLTRLPPRLIRDLAGNEQLAQQVIDKLRAFFRGVPYAKAVIGLSGGIDSAVSCKLGALAIGPENVIAVRLPYGDLNSRSNDVAAEVAKSCGLPPENLHLLDITAAVDGLWSEQTSGAFGPLSEKEAAIRRGNLCARMRMMKLMDVATHHRALLLGTENLTEDYLAYFTIGGDQISNVEPLAGLWKVEVFQMAQALGLPDSVLNRAPSAELWPGQTDEDEIGVSYEVIDVILSSRGTVKELLEELERCCRLNRASAKKTVTKVREHVRRMDGKRHAPHRIEMPNRLK